MHHQFQAVSLTYQNSPVAIRERLALRPDEVRPLLRRVKEVTGAQDILILSTCNRTELYYSHEEDLTDQIIGLLSIAKGISPSDRLSEYFVSYQDTTATVHHLFRVAMGLESQVVGDLQIVNQVKQAYQAAADEDTASPFLHRLLHTIFFTNKRVSQETTFRDGAASVSYVASELVDDLAAEFVQPKILVVGLGEIGADVCKNIAELPQRDSRAVTVMNRTDAKAEALATSLGFATRPFAELADAVAQADVVISSVAAPEPLITPKYLDAAAVHGHKYLIDLSVPRSVDPAVERVPGVLVYNLDDLRSKAHETLNKRVAAVPRVEEIVEEAVGSFGQWAQEMEVSPTIQRLKQTLEQIRQEEMARHLKSLDATEAARMDKITKGMMQKIIKLPVLQLKAACQRGEAETLIDVLNDLFDLEKQPVKK
ncbi:MAG: glutamyl-tRNA reductase [Tunicatimonas sp.]